MELLTVEQAAELLGTGPRFVRRLIEERRIGYTKLGRFVRLDRTDLEAFVAAGRVDPTTARPLPSQGSADPDGDLPERDPW